MIKNQLAIISVLFLSVIGSGYALETSVIDNTLEYGENGYLMVCGDDSFIANPTCDDIVYDDWNSSCKLLSFGTKNNDCLTNEITIKSGKESIKQQFFISRYKKILDEKLKHSTKNSPHSLAEKVFAAKLLGKEDLVDELLDELKSIRDNDNKCWPKNDCSIKETVDVLYFLSLASIDSSKRIYKDALIWLEANQNVATNNNWDLSISVKQNATCKLRLGSSVSEISLTEKYNSDIIFSSGLNVNISCDAVFCVRLFDEFGREAYDSCADEDEEVLFALKGGCWSDTRWVSCDAGLTAKALLINNLSTDSYSAAKNWLESELVLDTIGKKRINSTLSLLNNILAYATLKDDSLKDWILYSQNNSGSFGDVYDTLNAIMYLSSDDDQEFISDAKNWLLLNSPVSGWNNLKSDALMYYVMRSREPYIISVPAVIEGKDSSEFDIFHNFDDVKSVISTNDVVNIDVLDQTRGVISGVLNLETDIDGIYSGFIVVSDGVYNKSVPFILKNLPYLEADLSSEKKLFGLSGT